MHETACSPAAPAKCAVNVGMIHFQAGDLVSAYRFFQPLAEAGDLESIDMMVAICETAGDQTRADKWRAARSA